MIERAVLPSLYIELEVPYIKNVLTTIERYLELLEQLQDQINALWSASHS